MKKMIQVARVSPSMIRSVFLELRTNGYTDDQILALSAGLAELIETPEDGEGEALLHEGEPVGGSTDSPLGQDGLADLGYSEEYESLCSAGIPSL